MEKSVKVYTTDSYEIFNRLKGNRDVEKGRVKIIKNSIEKIGYISNPIIVNEKLEVIDGQGRLEALKELGMPVEYTIVNGLGIEECRAINQKPTSWKGEDFIKSYAEYGDENYIRLIELNKEYGLSYSVLISLQGQKKNISGPVSTLMKNGKLVITEDDFERIKNVCDYICKFDKIQKEIGGRSEIFYTCLAWLIQQKDVDRDRLETRIIEKYNKITPIAESECFLRQLSEIYNFGHPKKNWVMFEYRYKLADGKL